MDCKIYLPVTEWKLLWDNDSIYFHLLVSFFILLADHKTKIYGERITGFTGSLWRWKVTGGIVYRTVKEDPICYFHDFITQNKGVLNFTLTSLHNHYDCHHCYHCSPTCCRRMLMIMMAIPIQHIPNSVLWFSSLCFKDHFKQQKQMP